MAIGGEHADQVGCGLEDLGQPPAGLLDLLPLGDVRDHGDGTDDLAVGVAQGPGRDVHIDELAVAPPSDDLGLVQRLAPEDPAVKPAELLLLLLGHDGGQRAIQDLGLAPAEDPLGGGVPAEHVAVDIQGQDRQR